MYKKALKVQKVLKKYTKATLGDPLEQRLLKGPSFGPFWADLGTKGPQRGPTGAQRSPKGPQREPIGAHRNPKGSQKWAKRGTGRPPKATPSLGDLIFQILMPLCSQIAVLETCLSKGTGSAILRGAFSKHACERPWTANSFGTNAQHCFEMILTSLRNLLSKRGQKF